MVSYRNVTDGGRCMFAQCCIIPKPLDIVYAPLKIRFMRPIWDPTGADRTQVGPMMAPRTLLSGSVTVALIHDRGIVFKILYNERNLIPKLWLLFL